MTTSAGEDALVLEWRRPDTGAQVAVSTVVTELVDRREELVRLSCHYLVDLVPTPGLAELCEMYRQLIEFYSQRTIRDDHEMMLPHLAKRVAVAGETYQRPQFTLDDEE